MSLRFLTLPLLAGLCLGQQQLTPDNGPVESRQLDLPALAEPVKRQLKEALDRRDFKRAETILVEEIKANPKSEELLKAAGRLFLLDRDPVNAAIAFRKADKLHPLDPGSQFAMAIAFVGMGKSNWARPEFASLSQSDPTNPLYEYWLGRLDYDAQLFDSAASRFHKVTLLRPSFTRAWDNLALAQEALGLLDDAVKSYRHAVDLNRNERPPSPWPPLNLGILTTKLGRFGEAEVLLREALGYDPGLWTAHYRLGMNLHGQRKSADAMPELERATELAPTEPGPLYVLGQIYRNQGESAKAARVFARFEELKKVKRGDSAGSPRD